MHTMHIVMSFYQFSYTEVSKCNLVYNTHTDSQGGGATQKVIG